MTVLKTSEDFYELLSAYIAKAASENIKHAEVFFDAQNHPVPFHTFFPGARAVSL